MNYKRMTILLFLVIYNVRKVHSDNQKSGKLNMSLINPVTKTIVRDINWGTVHFMSQIDAAVAAYFVG